ncbi:MAG: TraR/DksA family transcriptional regulator [Candidatus Magasanikbacteria bacterium]
MTITKNMLDSKFLQEIEDLLLEQKAKLTSDLENFSQKDPHTSDEYNTSFSEYGDDMDSNTQEITEFLNNKPIEIQLEKELKDVTKALKSIKEGTYGICKYCNKPIEQKRLIARPTSGACVSCKKTITQEV